MTTTQLSQQDYGMNVGMNVEELKDLVPLLLTGFAALGTAIAWIFNRMDAKNKFERDFELAERNKLEAFFQSQIHQLQDEIHSQNAEITQLRRELSSYVRHVGILEGLLKAKGVEPPPFTVPGQA
jgi:uncharacterized protein HemX